MIPGRSERSWLCVLAVVLVLLQLTRHVHSQGTATTRPASSAGTSVPPGTSSASGTVGTISAAAPSSAANTAMPATTGNTTATGLTSTQKTIIIAACAGGGGILIIVLTAGLVYCKVKANKRRRVQGTTVGPPAPPAAADLSDRGR